MHSSGHDGVALQIRVCAIIEGGDSTAGNQAIQIRGADAAIILVAIGTSFNGEDPEAMSREIIQNAARKDYARLKQDHIADYQPLYRRTSIDLGRSSATIRRQPTDVRRKGVENGGDDPELVALFFQYGRYLVIAGSRADSPLPLALQGIWNDGLASSMGWTDDFHLDINTEQNYWPAEVCNLGGCQLPLFKLIEVMRTHGRATAKEMYGAPGWVVHTVTNPWGFTATGSTGWGIFVTAGFLDFPAALGSLDIQRRHRVSAHASVSRPPRSRGILSRIHGYRAETRLVSHRPIRLPGELVSHAVRGPRQRSMGNTCDRTFVYALYTMCSEASKTLDIDPDFRRRVEDARAKLPPFQ